jgi:hypothetical protein
MFRWRQRPSANVTLVRESFATAWAAVTQQRPSWLWAGLFLVITLAASLVWHGFWSVWHAQHLGRLSALHAQAALIQAELASGEMWQARRREANEVHLYWQHWRKQQVQAWQAMQVFLSVPPQGVQVEKVSWRDHQWQLTGWALSKGHWLAWQTRLAQVGLSPQAERAQWQTAQWRSLGASGAKQHAFELPMVHTLAPRGDP